MRHDGRAQDELRPLDLLPGFVETPGFPQRSRFSNRFVRSLVIDPDEVAERIVAAVERDRREIFVPRLYRIAPLAQALLPGVIARFGGRGARPAGD